NITLVNNNDGTYTFTNPAAGVPTVITNTTNSTLSVASGDLVLTDSEGNTVSIALSALGATNSTLAIDDNGTAGNSQDDSLVLTDNTGHSVTIPLSSVNILTTLVNNNNGTYTYTNEARVDTVIDVNAGALPFSNTASGLAATTVQGAIDELAAETNDAVEDITLVNNNDGTYTFTNPAAGVTTDIDTNANVLPFNNVASGLAGTTVQAAIDELATNEKEPWRVEQSNTPATANGENIYQSGNIGIGNFSGATDFVTARLDVKGGDVRVRDINTSTGTSTDRIVVADANGVLKTVPATPGVRTVITGYDAVDADETIFANATTADVLITLPSQPIVGKKYNIKKIDTSDNKVTISGNGKNIEDLASISGALPYQGWTLLYDGTKWMIISRI
ncbi:autotransporter outer membrane beta-barrel domain-containing protein, partial [Flavobacterium hauense]